MHGDAVRAELEAECAAELAQRPQACPAPSPPTAEVRCAVRFAGCGMLSVLWRR
jgi:hypothetical protein